jgi:hypothetical protein
MNQFSDQEIDAFVDAIQQEGLPTTTVSFLQRRFRLGYVRASQAIEELERRGVLGPVDPNDKYRRPVLANLPESLACQCHDLRAALKAMVELTASTPFSQKLQARREARRLLGI